MNFKQKRRQRHRRLQQQRRKRRQPRTRPLELTDRLALAMDAVTRVQRYAGSLRIAANG